MGRGKTDKSGSCDTEDWSNGFFFSGLVSAKQFQEYTCVHLHFQDISVIPPLR